MAEKKRVIKGKRKRTRRAKPKEKARQKQKQRQVVNVQVSSGGSGGGTSFIPMPQAPAFDYSLLANLIRPANTVDMPIRAMAPISEPMQIRAAESPTLAEAKKQSQERMPSSSEISTQTGPLRPAPPIPKADAPKVRKARTKVPIYQKMTEREAGYETFPSSESESGFIVRKKEGQAASMFRKYGSGGAFEKE